MNSSRILILGFIIIVALVGSLFLGEAVAQEDYVTVGVFFAVVVGLLVIKVLGTSIWVLMPLFITFSSSTRLLPIPLSIANIVTLFVIGVVGIQYLVGVVQFQWQLDRLDALLGLCLASMTVTYILNPVGLSILGSSTVGSRPYFEILLALAAYIILSGIQVKGKAVKSLPLLSLGVNGLLSCGMGVSYHFPNVGQRLNILYGGFMPHWDVSSQYGFQMAKRLSYLGSITDFLQRYVILRREAWCMIPSKLGLTFLLLLLTLVAGMLTGHRIMVVTWAAYLVIYTLLIRSYKGVFLIGCFGLMTVAGVYFIHHAVSPLPLSIQRSVSFLPGDWDRDVIQDAEGSIEWRMEMWEAVLFEEGRVHNKIMGDGFGFSARELALAQSMSTEGGRVNLSPEEMQEYFLVSGALHSGPLTAVRFVGWVGLFFFTVLAVSLARAYWKLCRRVENTPYWMACAFMGIPWIYFPVKYIFLYGDYGYNAPLCIVGVGVYKLLNKATR